jgi:hypothetical protein
MSGRLKAEMIPVLVFAVGRLTVIWTVLTSGDVDCAFAWPMYNLMLSGQVTDGQPSAAAWFMKPCLCFESRESRNVCVWSLSFNNSYQSRGSHYGYHHVFVLWRSRFWSWERDALLLSASLQPEFTAVIQNWNYQFVFLLCSIWDFHRGKVAKFLFVLNDVASFGWRFSDVSKTRQFS